MTQHTTGGGDSASSPSVLESLTVHREKRPGIWIAGVIAVAVAGLVLFSLVTNQRFKWDIVAEYIVSEKILAGLGLTLFLTLTCMAGSFILGIVLALMVSARNPVVQKIAQVYLWVFRGTPVLVQLLLWFNLAALYPRIGIPGSIFQWSTNDLISPLSAAVIGLTLNEAAYMAEIIRSGLASVDSGQVEASKALGMRGSVAFRRIVLPQAMRVIIPPTGNETISMLKYTSLVSVIALPELLYSAQIIASQNFQVIPLLMVATIWYLLLTSILSLVQSRIEKRFGRSTANLTVGKVKKL
ncbi:MAG TPA: amino acid ABC transporter permease [Terrimesophilobacter sp.]|jgi:amine acid ABC transporter, permease protein, 3-TM region, His/Glu/Gln/Arg/opine family|uniref:amino acid ABC transporter permease n=1 Tax=Terrimesophilobacter sp. TaxID=2906435 RepID=UPI002F9443C1